jgi:hypothetical protein
MSSPNGKKVALKRNYLSNLCQICSFNVRELLNKGAVCVEALKTIQLVPAIFSLTTTTFETKKSFSRVK